MNHPRGEGGYIVLLVIMAMSLLMLLGSYFLEHTWKESMMALNHEKKVQTYYVAEAGIELAWGVLSQDFYFIPAGGFLEGQVEEGYFQVFLGKAEGNRRLITSTGFGEKAEKEIRTWAVQEEGAEKIKIQWVRPLPDN